MKLHKLTKVTAKSKKRLGRGLGSGKGKTGGRGTKGQKARGKVALGFIGGTLPLYKKLPFRRGLGNPKRSAKMITVPLSKLAAFKKDSVINLQSLVEKGIVKKRDVRNRDVKIVGGGEVILPLVVKLAVTSAAAEKITKVGGKVLRD